MSTALTCLKTFVNILNFIVFLLGCFLLGGVLFLKFGTSVYLKPGVDAMYTQITSYGATKPANIDYGLDPLLGIAYIALGALGGYLILVTVIGMCGTCYQRNGGIVTYVVLLFLVFIAELVMFLLFMFGVLDGIMKDRFLSTLPDFAGFKSDQTSSLWNTMNQNLGCCGVDGYMDFQNQSPNWLRTVGGATLQTPKSCCKPGSLTATCGINVATSNYANTGCFTLIKTTYIDNQRTWYWVGGGCILGLQLLLILLAIITAVVMKNEYERKKRRDALGEVELILRQERLILRERERDERERQLVDFDRELRLREKDETAREKAIQEERRRLERLRTATDTETESESEPEKKKKKKKPKKQKKAKKPKKRSRTPSESESSGTESDGSRKKADPYGAVPYPAYQNRGYQPPPYTTIPRPYVAPVVPMVVAPRPVVLVPRPLSAPVHRPPPPHGSQTLPGAGRPTTVHVPQRF